MTTVPTAIVDRSQLSPSPYEKLKGNEVRIIHLHPGEASDDIVVTIDVVDSRRTNFNAISYAWGSTDRIHRIYARPPTRHVTEDGEPYSNAQGEPTGTLMITDNLLKALRTIRSNEVYIPLWVDSICINQEDLAEKTEQVKSMSLIYGMAASTLIYLGEGSEAMDLAIMAIRYLSSLKDKPAQEVPENLVDGLPIKVSIKPPSIGAWPHEIRDPWDALMAFLELPWFHRVWIVQEVVLSQQPVILTSSRVIPWEAFLDACTVIQNSKVGEMDAGRVHANIALHLETQRKTMRRCIDATNKILSGGGKLEESYLGKDSPEVMEMVKENHFAYLQMRTRGCHATDPRDHVFALLGIAKGGGLHMPEVDYTHTLTEVYTRLAYAWHKTQKRSPLSWLQCVVGSYDKDDLPTWVPDWRASWRIQVIYPIVGKMGASGEKGVEGVKIKFPELRTPVHLPLRLEIRGCRLLKIKDVESVKSTRWQTLRHSQLINEFPEPYPTTYMDYDMAFSKAVMASKWEDFVLKDSIRQESFWTFRRNGTSKQRLRSVYKRDLEGPPGPTIQLVSRMEEGYSSPRIHILNSGARRGPTEPRYTQERLYDTIYNCYRYDVVVTVDGLVRQRKWFISEDGFMGLVHEITKPGDIIVHFLGGTTLFVLRKKRQKEGQCIWGFVGECYVVGLMNGEVNEGMPADVIEDFIIE